MKYANNVIERASKKARIAVGKYPSIMDEVDDAWQLMMSEIEDGASEEMETERFLDWLNNFIKEKEK